MVPEGARIPEYHGYSRDSYNNNALPLWSVNPAVVRPSARASMSRLYSRRTTLPVQRAREEKKTVIISPPPLKGGGRLTTLSCIKYGDLTESRDPYNKNGPFQRSIPTFLLVRVPRFRHDAVPYAVLLLQNVGT